jgi:hypothetical protein
MSVTCVPAAAAHIGDQKHSRRLSDGLKQHKRPTAWPLWSFGQLRLLPACWQAKRRLIDFRSADWEVSLSITHSHLNAACASVPEYFPLNYRSKPSAVQSLPASSHTTTTTTNCSGKKKQSDSPIGQLSGATDGHQNGRTVRRAGRRRRLAAGAAGTRNSGRFFASGLTTVLHAGRRPKQQQSRQPTVGTCSVVGTWTLTGAAHNKTPNGQLNSSTSGQSTG